MKDRLAWAAVMVACVEAPVLVAAGAPPALRLGAVLALFALAPGIVLTRLLAGTRTGIGAEPGLVVAVSLGVVTVIAQAMVWFGAWSPAVFVYLLAAACLAGLGVVALRAHRAAPAAAIAALTAPRAVADRVVARLPASCPLALAAASPAAAGHGRGAAPARGIATATSLRLPAGAGGVALRRARSSVPTGLTARPGLGRPRLVRRGARTAPAQPPVPAAPRHPLARALPVALLACALGLWAWSVLHADLERMAGLGLLDALPPTYPAAVAVLLGGFAVALTAGPPSGRTLALYVIALVIVLHATAPLLYEEPRYAWTYKHLGVINLIAETGGVDRELDVYNNWPSFFAACAWLSAVTGVPPIAYAGWAELFFGLLNVAAVVFALRGLTGDARLLWTATLIFVLGNWLGQEYLAPQALAFALSMVVLGLCLRVRVPLVRARSRLRRWWSGGLALLASRRTFRGVSSRPSVAGDVPPRAALVLGGACFLAVVLSHQLSPLILVASAAALALAVPRVPWWVVGSMVVVEGWWLMLAQPFLAEHFSLFDPELSAGSRPPGVDFAEALPGFQLVLVAPAVVALVMTGLAAFGLLGRLRTGHRDLAAVFLAAAPVLVAGLQTYGGEGPLRAYLFGLPWLAFLAAAACLGTLGRRRSPIVRAGQLAVVSVAVAACLLACFGRELANHIHTDEVAAAVWYERHVPTRAIVLYATGQVPDRLTARYPLVEAAPPAFFEASGLRGHRLGARDVKEVRRLAQRYPRRRVFLVLSHRQGAYGRLYGLLPDASIDGLDERAAPEPGLPRRLPPRRRVGVPVPGRGGARMTARLRARATDPLLRSAYSLIANGVVTAVLGLGFWIVAARLYSPAELGRDAALVAAMIELSAISQLNLHNAIIRFLPGLRRHTARALAAAYGLSGGSGLVVGVAFVTIAPIVADDLGFLVSDRAIAVAYVTAQVLWSWFVLQDSALTALRRATWVPLENGAFGLIKLAVLPLPMVLGVTHGVFLAWFAPVIVLLVPINWLLFRRVIPRHVREDRTQVSRLLAQGPRRVARFMALDYGGTVLARAGTSLLPLLVVATLGASANAYFYVAFSIVLAFDMLFFNVGISLVVEGGRAEDRIRALAGTVVRRFLVLLLGGTAVLVIAAPLILAPFGPDYVRESTPLLRVLALACPLRAIATLYSAVARVRGRGTDLLAVEGGLTCVGLGGAAVLAQPLGLEGIALAWVGAGAIVALAVAPFLAGFWRSGAASHSRTQIPEGAA